MKIFFIAAEILLTIAATLSLIKYAKEKREGGDGRKAEVYGRWAVLFISGMIVAACLIPKERDYSVSVPAGEDMAAGTQAPAEEAEAEKNGEETDVAPDIKDGREKAGPISAGTDRNAADKDTGSGQEKQDSRTGKAEGKEEKDAADQSGKDAQEDIRKEDGFTGWTDGQKEAYESAERYVDAAGISRQGLIDQLSSESGGGFAPEDAEFAVEELEQRDGVNWNKEAEEAARFYLDITEYSRQALTDQLSSEYGDKFTREQAEWAADKVF